MLIDTLPGNRAQQLSLEAKEEVNMMLKLNCKKFDLLTHIRETQKVHLLPKDLQNMKEKLKPKTKPIDKKPLDNEEVIKIANLLQNEYGE